MICACGGKMLVVDSCDEQEEGTRRLRECDACHKLLTTIEMSVERGRWQKQRKLAMLKEFAAEFGYTIVQVIK